MSVALVSPGLRFRPCHATSVEIYLDQLSRELANQRNVMLYGRGLPTAQITGLSYRPVRGTYVREVARQIRNDRPTVVQIDNRPLFVRPIRRHLPNAHIILNLHSLTYVSPSQISGRMALRDAFNTADAIVGNSHYLRRVLQRRVPSARHKMHVIAPGADLTRFVSRFSVQGARIRKEERANRGVGDRIVILYAGRFIPRKGIDVLLRAVRQVRRNHPNVVLWIAGGRPIIGKSAFHRRIALLSKGLPVKYFGFVSPAQLARLYLGSDIFVCPSQQSEAFGMVNIEAAATGLPVVASGQWGIRDSIRDGSTGILVGSYRSPDAFAKALGKLCANKALRERMGKNGREWVEQRFPWSRVARDFSALYNRLEGL